MVWLIHFGILGFTKTYSLAFLGDDPVVGAFLPLPSCAHQHSCPPQQLKEWNHDAISGDLKMMIQR
jgi:hypothetical protein